MSGQGLDGQDGMCEDRVVVVITEDSVRIGAAATLQGIQEHIQAVMGEQDVAQKFAWSEKNPWKLDFLK